MVTIPEALAGAGYRSYLAGKWHLSDQMVEKDGDEARISKASWPIARGFDRFYGTIAGAGNYFFPAALVEDERPIAPEGEDYYYTDAVSDRAAAFVREHAARHPDQPFFLYVAYTAPHWPLHAREEDVARYRGRYDAGWDALREERHARMLELGVVERRWPLSPRDPDAPAWEEAEHKAWQARRMEVYAAQVEVMDRGIGRIVEALRETGVLDDTLLLFLSDNGGCAEELWDAPAWLRRFLPLAFRGPARDGRPVQRGNDPAVMPGGEHTFQSYGLPWANASNTPFRLYKQQVHEGGIATPLIAHWPAGLGTARGALSDAPGHVVDLMPTLLELAGVSHPRERGGRPSRELRGESLVPILRGRPPGAGAHLLGAPGQPRAAAGELEAGLPLARGLGALRPGGGPHGAEGPGRRAARARARARRPVRGVGGGRGGGSLALGDPSPAPGRRGAGPGRAGRRGPGLHRLRRR